MDMETEIKGLYMYIQIVCTTVVSDMLALYTCHIFAS